MNETDDPGSVRCNYAWNIFPGDEEEGGEEGEGEGGKPQWVTR